MKKFMKALALALALCMVLSVSAFAAVEKSNAAVNKTTHTVDFNITGVGTEQVALLVLKNGIKPSNATENDILFIDQTAGVSGTATFSATIAEGNDVVDVYVGSTSIAADAAAGNGSAWEIYPDLEVAETSSITIAAGNTADVIKIVNVGNGINRPGAAIKVDFNSAPVDKMIWVLTNAENAKVYSKPVALSGNDYATLDGEVWFTGVFSSTALEDLAFGNIAKVAALFHGTNSQTYYAGEAADKDAILGAEIKNN